MKTTVNWGIIGLGKIARKFLHDLNLSARSNVYAMGSRSLDKARQYQYEYGASKAYGNYEELLSDKNVDVVYIATPHSHHYPLLLECIERGVNVLCEKPICVNSEQVKDVKRRAEQSGVFVMEAFWTRFLPYFDPLQEFLKRETADIKSLYADFCFYSEYNPQSRLYDPGLAGGSLLDIGIYPVFLANMIMGKPMKIKSTGLIEKGVDLRFSSLFEYENGKSAMVSSDIKTESRMDAVLKCGDKVVIIPERWHEADGFVVKSGHTYRSYDYPKIGLGYYHEIEHVNEMLLGNRKFSTVFGLDNSVALMELLDRIRSQIGLDYPDNIEHIR